MISMKSNKFWAIGIAALALSLALLNLALERGKRPHSVQNPASSWNPAPREAIENLIKSELKEEFWPENWEPHFEEEKYCTCGFGRKLADHYWREWKVENVNGSDLYFLVCAAYDKKTKHFIGNKLWVFQPDLRPIGEKPWKEVPLDGMKLARLVFRCLPEKWDHSGPHFCEGAGYLGEVWKNLQQLGPVKRQLEILVFKNYNWEWDTTLWTEKKLVSGKIVIILSLYYPENPWYEDFGYSGILKLYQQWFFRGWYENSEDYYLRITYYGRPIERAFEITPDNRFRWLDVELRINGRKVGEGPGVKFVFNDSSPPPGIYRLNSPPQVLHEGRGKLMVLQG